MIKVSDVNKKYLRIIAYLIGSGFLGYVLATYVANNVALTAIFAPAINFVIYIIANELKKEGYLETLREK